MNVQCILSKQTHLLNEKHFRLHPQSFIECNSHQNINNNLQIFVKKQTVQKSDLKDKYIKSQLN